MTSPIDCKKIIQKILDRLEIKNPEEHPSEVLVYYIWTKESDEVIDLTFRQLGIKLNPYCYRYYGERKDKSFVDKQKMFKKMFEEYGQTKFCPLILRDCFSFSQDLNEIITFLKWFKEKGAQQSGCEFLEAYNMFGNKIFESDLHQCLGASHHREFLLHNIHDVIRSKRPMEEKWIKIDRYIQYVIYFSTKDVQAAIDTKNFELVDLTLKSSGTRIDVSILDKLVFRENSSTEFTQDDFNFTKRCLELVIIRPEIQYQLPKNNNFISSKYSKEDDFRSKELFYWFHTLCQQHKIY